MSLPLHPERVYEYEWSEFGLAITIKGGDAMIIKKADVTDEIRKVGPIDRPYPHGQGNRIR
jgi:hypothetical protein